MDRTNEDKTPIVKNIAVAEQVAYQVNDIKPIETAPDLVKMDAFPVFPIKKKFSTKTISSGKRVCHSCGNDYYGDSDEEYRQRIEYIKGQILTKLGMKEPPQLRKFPDIDYNVCELK